MRKRLPALLLALVLSVGLTACGGEEPVSAQVFAMDTVMLFTAYGEGAAGAVGDGEKEVRRLEELLSRTRADSAVSHLNSGGEVSVDREVRDLIDAARDYTEATGGAFDISIAPVVSAWGFTTDSYRVPDGAEIAELLGHVGMEHVKIAGETVALDPGTQIDLGGIAKGYASDRMAEIYEEHGVSQGTAALGGNIYAKGNRPDGTPWRVGVQDPARPEDSSAFAGILELSDAFAVTSGGYQRYFEENGKRYHHIIDPADGAPADSDLTSVTVVADQETGSGTMCDALSTALYVMGEEKALDFWRGGAYDFDLVLVTADGRVVVTEGLADRFTVDEESGYNYEIVS